MKRKTLIGLIVGGICLLAVISVLLVGLIDGVWPWDKDVEYPLLNIFRPTQTEPVEGTNGEGDSAEVGSKGTEPIETTESGGQAGNDEQPGSSTDSAGQTPATNPQDPTTGAQAPTVGTDVGIEIEGPTQGGNTGGGTSSDGSNDQPDGDSTIPTEEGAQYLSFQDLLDLLNQKKNQSGATDSTNG